MTNNPKSSFFINDSFVLEYDHFDKLDGDLQKNLSAGFKVIKPKKSLSFSIDSKHTKNQAKRARKKSKS